MIEAKENNFLASPATASFNEPVFRPFTHTNSGSQAHHFRSPMTIRAGKMNHENQCPISISKLGESSCSDFVKSCASLQDFRFGTDQKVPLKQNANCDNIVHPPCQITKTPVKSVYFSLSGASSSHCKLAGGERQSNIANAPMTSQTQTKLRLTDHDSSAQNTIFDNKSSVVAFSCHESTKDEMKIDLNNVDSEDMPYCMRRP